MDWAKYTDEGWYGDGAIRHFQRGHWHVPGDFNPAAALPVWPLLEAVLFRFTGVNLTAARALTVAIFACILCTSYLLLRRWQLLSSGRRIETSLAPAIAVLLLAVSPFCYVFTRMAILEPLLILFTLLALLAGLLRPQVGRLRFGNTALVDTSAKQFTPAWRRHFALVFQDGLLFYYFSSVDQNAHMLWSKYDDELLDIYRGVDTAIGEAMAKAGAETTLIIMSDHGFARFNRADSHVCAGSERGRQPRARQKVVVDNGDVNQWR